MLQDEESVAKDSPRLFPIIMQTFLIIVMYRHLQDTCYCVCVCACYVCVRAMCVAQADSVLARLHQRPEAHLSRSDVRDGGEVPACHARGGVSIR
eukprot:1459019-Amphidinium_carterae.1